jgi:hypothetical protein
VIGEGLRPAKEQEKFSRINAPAKLHLAMRAWREENFWVTQVFSTETLVAFTNA